MIRFVMVLILIAGGVYLYQERHRPQPSAPPPAPPILDADASPPALSAQEIERVRASTKDADPAVRWAAIELLYRLRDPQTIQILETMLALDTETSVRKSALDMLRQGPKPTAIKDILLALKDQEKDIRVAALIALGEMGDITYSDQVSALLNDPEPEVRLQAIHTLGRFQELKRNQYKNLAEELKHEYEEAVKKAQQHAEQAALRDVPPPK